MTKTIAPPECPYCGQTSKLVTGDVVYPHRPDLAHRHLYVCEPCDARVGCHKGTTRPLGRLADAELRRAKQEAHAAFDPLWRSGAFKRNAAYKLLAKKLGIKRRDCHIGMFNVEMCFQMAKACKELLADLKKDGLL